MPRGLTKVGLANRSQSQATGQEVAVLGEGTVMTTEIGITREEAAVEVWIGMIVTGIAGGTEIIVAVAGAAAAVTVLITTGAGEEAVMMMSAEAEAEAKAEVDLWIVPLLLGVVLLLAEVLPHIGLHLLGVEVLIGIVVIEGPQLHMVFRLQNVLLILEVNPLESQMLMNDLCGLCGSS